MKRHTILCRRCGDRFGLVSGVSSRPGSGAKPPLGFFVTSTMHSGNLGGLAGADGGVPALGCRRGGGRPYLACLFKHPWHRTQATVNARDRIGSGPWNNANGVMVAGSVADFTRRHSARQQSHQSGHGGDGKW